MQGLWLHPITRSISSWTLAAKTWIVNTTQEMCPLNTWKCLRCIIDSGLEKAPKVKDMLLNSPRVCSSMEFLFSDLKDQRFCCRKHKSCISYVLGLLPELVCPPVWVRRWPLWQGLRFTPDSWQSSCGEEMFNPHSSGSISFVSLIQCPTHFVGMANTILLSSINTGFLRPVLWECAWENHATTISFFNFKLHWS